MFSSYSLLQAQQDLAAVKQTFEQVDVTTRFKLQDLRTDIEIDSFNTLCAFVDEHLKFYKNCAAVFQDIQANILQHVDHIEEVNVSSYHMPLPSNDRHPLRLPFPACAAFLVFVIFSCYVLSCSLLTPFLFYTHTHTHSHTHTLTHTLSSLLSLVRSLMLHLFWYPFASIYLYLALGIS